MIQRLIIDFSLVLFPSPRHRSLPIRRDGIIAALVRLPEKHPPRAPSVPPSELGKSIFARQTSMYNNEV